MCSIAAGKGARLEESSGTEAMAMTGQCGGWETVLELMGSCGWDSLLHSLLRWCLSQPGVALWPWLDK